MRRKNVSLLFPVFASVLSGVLLFLAFPSYDQGWLSWVALIPLFIAISGKSPVQGFFLSFVCSVVYFGVFFRWSFEIPGYRFFHHVLLDVYLGLFLGIFGWTFNFISRRLSVTSALLAAPFIWVSLEYIRSNLGFLSLPWPIFAYSQYQYLPAIQVASITGAYGVSFLLVLVNSTITFGLFALVQNPGWHRSIGFNIPSKRSVCLIILSTAVLMILTLTYGWTTLSRQQTGKNIKVSVVQGNIDRKKRANPRKHAKFIMQRHIDLTRKASKEQPDLIIWPEAATPGYVLKNKNLHQQLISLIRETKTYFLIGSAEYSKFLKNPSDHGKVGNTALFLSPKGKLLGQYLKIILIPFGEYIPYNGIVPWPDFIVPKGQGYFDMAGKELTVFELNDVRFGVIICWETAFSELFRGFVKKGADFMVNIVNEGWFGKTGAPYQFLTICVFRAIENRVPLVRATNTGVSCFIDPYGRITDRVSNNGKDIFVEGYLTRELSASGANTFYTIYGDILVYLSFLTTAFFILVAGLKPKMRANY